MSNALDEIVEGLDPWPGMISVMAASRAPVLLALDIGSSGVRAALFDDEGNEIRGAGVRVDYPLDTLDFANFDAEELLAHVTATLDALFARFQDSTRSIELIAISCFWHSLMGVDAAGTATTPVFGWADTSGAPAIHELRSRFDEARVHARTGCRFHPSYWPAKLHRLRQQDPAAFRNTTRWLSFADYLTLQFFGETAASVSMASGTGLFDQRTCEWDGELMEMLAVRVESLPEIASPQQTFNVLRPAYAARWPQLSEARLFPAVGDGAANNVGAGCIATDKVALMIGTSGAMRLSFKGDPLDQTPGELWSYRIDRDRIIIGGALSDGGGLYKWIRESFLFGTDGETIESELALLSPDSHGLTVLPFWSGERSTGWNPDARGGILGLKLQTRPIEILRATMEAIAYRFAMIADALEPLAPNARLIASGHALRSSPTWMQMLADVLGRDMALSELSEASMRGAALLALEAAGKIRTIEEFSVPVEMVFAPNLRRHEQYQAGLERQQRIYKQLFTKTSDQKPGR
jgi:gluconokinase